MAHTLTLLLDAPLALGGPVELWIILGVVLLFFGGRKLPELARSMGSSVTQFRKGLESADEEGHKAVHGAGAGDGDPKPNE